MAVSVNAQPMRWASKSWCLALEDTNCHPCNNGTVSWEIRFDPDFPWKFLRHRNNKILTLKMRQPPENDAEAQQSNWKIRDNGKMVKVVMAFSRVNRICLLWIVQIDKSNDLNAWQKWKFQTLAFLINCLRFCWLQSLRMLVILNGFMWNRFFTLSRLKLPKHKICLLGTYWFKWGIILKVYIKPCMKHDRKSSQCWF